MSYSLSQALDQLASRSSLAELIDLVKNTAATIQDTLAISTQHCVTKQ